MAGNIKEELKESDKGTTSYYYQEKFSENSVY